MHRIVRIFLIVGRIVRRWLWRTAHGHQSHWPTLVGRNRRTNDATRLTASDVSAEAVMASTRPVRVVRKLARMGMREFPLKYLSPSADMLGAERS